MPMRSFCALATGRDNPNKAKARLRMAMVFEARMREGREDILRAGFIRWNRDWNQTGKEPTLARLIA